MILVVIAAVLLLAVACRLAVPVAHRVKAARELRGDWWSRFERDLRQYSNQFQKSARESEWQG